MPTARARLSGVESAGSSGAAGLERGSPGFLSCRRDRGCGRLSLRAAGPRRRLMTTPQLRVSQSGNKFVAPRGRRKAGAQILSCCGGPSPQPPTGAGCAPLRARFLSGSGRGRHRAPRGWPPPGVGTAKLGCGPRGPGTEGAGAAGKQQRRHGGWFGGAGVERRAPRPGVRSGAGLRPGSPGARCAATSGSLSASLGRQRPLGSSADPDPGGCAGRADPPAGPLRAASLF